jgi:hypothetical protein
MPTWIIVRAVGRFLPQGHPWKKRRFTYQEWISGQTTLCKEFDLVIGGSVTCLIIVLGILILRP